MQTREFEANHVLVRSPEFKPDNKKWVAASYERETATSGKTKYFCSGSWWLECIPYRLNEELLGTTDDPKDIDKLQWGDKCQIWDDEKGWLEGILCRVDLESPRPWSVFLKPRNKGEISEVYSGSVMRLLKQ